MTLESNKISALLDVLDFSPDIGQKTLIVANCVQEVEDVFNVSFSYTSQRFASSSFVHVLCLFSNSCSISHKYIFVKSCQ